MQLFTHPFNPIINVFFPHTEFHASKQRNFYQLDEKKKHYSPKIHRSEYLRNRKRIL